MLRTCLILCGLVLSGPAFAAPLSEAGKESIAAFCNAEWPAANSQMRNTCMKDQTEAAEKVLIVGDFLLDEEKPVLVACMLFAQKEYLKTYDWQVVDICLAANILGVPDLHHLIKPVR